MKKRILSMVLVSGFFLTGYPSLSVPAQSQEIQLNLRTQILIQDEAKRNTWQIINRKKTIPTSQIAIIICDVWDKHWSRGATERINEMAPRMNQVVKAARAKGIQIIHAPSRCVKFYRKTPARQRMIAAMPTNFTFAESIVAEGEKGARNSIKDLICKIKQKIKSVSKREKPSPYPPLPFSCPDGGSDTNHGNEYPHRVWTRQHPAIEIDHEKDVISDNGKEIHNFLRQRGITNIAIIGVHTNICILNRSFGIKNMIEKNKKTMNVVLVRDLTDAMYNPADPPYVSHEEGTQLVIGYIEKFYCPTITSSDLINN